MSVSRLPPQNITRQCQTCGRDFRTSMSEEGGGRYCIDHVGVEPHLARSSIGIPPTEANALMVAVLNPTPENFEALRRLVRGLPLSDELAGFVKGYSENAPDVESGDEEAADVADTVTSYFQEHAANVVTQLVEKTQQPAPIAPSPMGSTVSSDRDDARQSMQVIVSSAEVISKVAMVLWATNHELRDMIAQAAKLIERHIPRLDAALRRMDMTVEAMKVTGGGDAVGRLAVLLGEAGATVRFNSPGDLAMARADGMKKALEEAANETRARVGNANGENETDGVLLALEGYFRSLAAKTGAR